MLAQPAGELRQLLRRAPRDSEVLERVVADPRKPEPHDAVPDSHRREPLADRHIERATPASAPRKELVEQDAGLAAEHPSSLVESRWRECPRLGGDRIEDVGSGRRLFSQTLAA